MADREKVIKGITHHKLSMCDMSGKICPYWNEDDGCSKKMLEDVLSLLKEQEAKSVESIQMDRSDKWGTDLSGYCPSCKRLLKNRFNKQFCGECGQAVKWE